MDIKKVLMGEKMPDKNDPQYREQYEREVRAGQKFAEKTKLNIVFENPRMGKRPQKGLSGHRVRLGNLPVRLECHQHDKILQCEQGAKTPHGSGASRESPSGAT